MQHKKDSLEYYIWLAKLAEKGKITGIFFADVYGVDDTFPGQMDVQFKAGANCAQMDPVVFVTAMASVTKSLCFGITGSTSYINVSVVLPRCSKPCDLRRCPPRVSAFCSVANLVDAGPCDEGQDSMERGDELLDFISTGQWNGFHHAPRQAI